MIALQGLPHEIHPDRFSADEDDEKAKGKVSDEARFKAFVAKNEYGFFLFGQRARYNVVLRPKDGYSNIVIDGLGDGLTESDAVVILEYLGKAGSSFAFAASPDEYHHRNRYVRTLGANQFEAWIGRDLRKYQPGLYWLTVLSKEHADVLSGLMSTLGAIVTQIDSEHCLIKAFDNPNEWRRCAGRIDEWLAEHPAFFSKYRVIAQLDAAPDIGALSELAAELR